MTLPSLVEPTMAAALLSGHLREFMDNSPRVDSRWVLTATSDPLQWVVQIPASSNNAEPTETSTTSYRVLIDGSYYDAWPPRVEFVAPTTDGSWRRARIGEAAFPFISGSPGAPSTPSGPQAPFPFALHDSYSFNGREGQLVCFSYSLEYYFSGHTPTPEQTWKPGEDRVDATLNRLALVLSSPAHLGPSGEAR